MYKITFEYTLNVYGLKLNEERLKHIEDTLKKYVIPPPFDLEREILHDADEGIVYIGQAKIEEIKENERRN